MKYLYYFLLRYITTKFTYQGEMAIESLLADGEEYVVTLEESTEGELLLEDGQEETLEIIVPEADVECEVANVS